MAIKYTLTHSLSHAVLVLVPPRARQPEMVISTASKIRKLPVRGKKKGGHLDERKPHLSLPPLKVQKAPNVIIICARRDQTVLQQFVARRLHVVDVHTDHVRDPLQVQAGLRVGIRPHGPIDPVGIDAHGWDGAAVAGRRMLLRATAVLMQG